MPKKGPQRYEDKRDASRTTEPFGESVSEGTETLVGAFVVHLHHATHAHYDLRIEANGALASFAVPKGPSLDPEEKRLAIRTEDHPLEYLDFEDVIPDGEYGGGPMIAWDRGTVRYLEGPSERGLLSGKLDMMLSGRKLRGRFALVKLKNEPQGWLFFKKRDAYATPNVAAGDAVTTLDRSVLSGLTVSELERRDALGEALCKRADTLVRQARTAQTKPIAVDPSALPFATFVESAALPSLPGYSFEAELDGMPARVLKDGENVVLIAHGDASRRDLSEFYPEIVRAVQSLAPSSVVLEGAVVTFDGTGAPSLSKLAERARLFASGASHEATLDTPVTFLCDDVLAVGHHAVAIAPYTERRALLQEIVRGEGILRTSPSLPGPEGVARKLATNLGLRRVVAKRNDAPYLRAEKHDEKLDRVRVTIGPHAEVARIDHGNTKAALREVRITNPDKVYFPEKGYTKARVIAYYRAVANVLLPHVCGRPVTVVRYPDGIHGKHFFQWNVPPRMPPWMRTLAFKDEEAPVEKKGAGPPPRTKRGFVIDDLPSLLYVANLGVLPIHVFSSKAESLARCDYVALDFDVKLSTLANAVTLARTLREILDATGLVGFPKTSGQTGLHVLVPLGRGHGYDTARALVELLGRMLVNEHPKLATMERIPQKRGDRVYVDVIQTGPTRTLVAPYSLRAVPEATVSWPLEWDEVREDLDPGRFTLETVPSLILERTCPMATFETCAPDVPRAVARLAERWARFGG